MKNLFLTILSLLFITGLTSCEDACDITTDIEVLRTERHSINNEISYLKGEIKTMKSTLENIYDEHKEVQIILNKRQPKYVLYVELRQKRKGLDQLDISKQMKDSMNAVEFPLHVDRETYRKYRVGSTIMEADRGGSMMMEGTYSAYVITVKGKEILD